MFTNFLMDLDINLTKHVNIGMILNLYKLLDVLHHVFLAGVEEEVEGIVAHTGHRRGRRRTRNWTKMMS